MLLGLVLLNNNKVLCNYYIVKAVLSKRKNKY
jgi:hypothetical protein